MLLMSIMHFICILLLKLMQQLATGQYFSAPDAKKGAALLPAVPRPGSDRPHLLPLGCIMSSSNSCFFEFVC
jgi:hypothetical protein